MNDLLVLAEDSSMLDAGRRFDRLPVMLHATRVEHPGAIYHVMDRGNRLVALVFGLFAAADVVSRALGQGGCFWRCLQGGKHTVIMVE